MFANLTTQDDAKKIAELRSTIKSLQMQIEVYMQFTTSGYYEVDWL